MVNRVYQLQLSVKEFPGVIMVEGWLSDVADDGRSTLVATCVPRWLEPDSGLGDPIAELLDVVARWAKPGDNARQLRYSPTS